MQRQSILRRHLAPAILLAGFLAGCATPAQLPPGTPQAQVQERFGAPFERHALPGGERWAYPGGSWSQETWMVDFDAAGRVSWVRQVRTAENFGRIRIGVDTEADVRREFGPPREIQAFSRVNLRAWLYPYRESNMWHSEMAVYFDPQGIVRRVESGPDPRFIGNGKGRAD